MRGVSVIGSRLKSTKLPELYHIVPADSITAKISSSSCYVFDAHGDGSSGRAASSALSLGILTLPMSTHLVLQFVCDVVKETGKEVSPFIHIGLDWSCPWSEKQKDGISLARNKISGSQLLNLRNV